MAEKLKLTMALGDAGPVRALKDGTVSIDGVEPDFVKVSPIIAAFRRMVRESAYDVCEMAPTTYLIARAYGAPFKALPIVLMRRFHHHGLVKHPNAGIEGPTDLAGRRVGVRAYSVTTGVWTRGILQNEYGLDPASVRWIVDDDEHVAAMPLPPNVVRAPQGKSLVSMMAAGEIDAGFTGAAGIGRAGAPGEGWNTGGVAAHEYPEVIADAARAEADWYRRTGVYPIHAVVVVKDQILSTHPWLPAALLEAFEAAKQPYLERLAKGEAPGEADQRHLRDMKLVGDDPLPYGLAPNIPAIDMLIKYAVQQGLIDRSTDREAFFVRI